MGPKRTSRLGAGWEGTFSFVFRIYRSLCPVPTWAIANPSQRDQWDACPSACGFLMDTHASGLPRPVGVKCMGRVFPSNFWVGPMPRPKGSHKKRAGRRGALRGGGSGYISKLGLGGRSRPSLPGNSRRAARQPHGNRILTTVACSHRSAWGRNLVPPRSHAPTRPRFPSVFPELEAAEPPSLDRTFNVRSS